MPEVVVFAADHIHRDQQIRVVVYELVRASQLVLCIRQESQDRNLEPDGNTGIPGVSSRHSLTQDIERIVRRDRRTIGPEIRTIADLELDVAQAFLAKRLHVAEHRFRLQPWIEDEDIQALPVCLEEFIAPLVGLVQPDTVQPARSFRFVQFHEVLVFAFLAIAKLFVVERSDIAKHQEVGVDAECIAAVSAAIVDSNLGVVLVAIVCLGQCKFVPPFREDGAGEMIVKITTFRHVVKHPVEVFAVTVVPDVIEPVRQREWREHYQGD